jgi:hypothetical protein
MGMITADGLLEFIVGRVADRMNTLASKLFIRYFPTNPFMYGDMSQ